MSDLSPQTLFGLEGLVAVVTGATGRLGAVMSLALAAAGAEVWLVGRDTGRLKVAADGLSSQGLRCVVARCNVTRAEDVVELGDALRAGPGRLDVLVHNAHIGRGGTLATARPEDFAEAADLALAAFQRLLGATRDLLTVATVDSSPVVIAVASMYGIVSPKPALYASPHLVNPPYYGAVKAGLLQLARYAAVELGPLGIRVNSLTPGPFPGGADPAFVEMLGQQSPLGRVGTPAEIATALLFLASPHSSYVTGANVVVDGGWTAW